MPNLMQHQNEEGTHNLIVIVGKLDISIEKHQLRATLHIATSKESQITVNQAKEQKANSIFKKQYSDNHNFYVYMKE